MNIKLSSDADLVMVLVMRHDYLSMDPSSVSSSMNEFVFRLCVILTCLRSSRVDWSKQFANAALDFFSTGRA